MTVRKFYKIMDEGMPFRIENYNNKMDDTEILFKSWIGWSIPQNILDTEVIYVNIGNCSDIDMPCLIIEIAED